MKNNLGIPQNRLPQKMLLTFSPRFIKNTIESIGGFVSIQNISDLKKDTVTTVFKYINYKYFYTSRPKEIPCCFDIPEKPEIVFINDSMEIAGMMCYKAKVIFPSVNLNHEIYYTKEINAKIINKNTIYEKIPGILMRFQMEMGNLTLLFHASKVELCNINPDEFKLPSGYKNISKEHMIKIINQLLE